MKLKLKRLPLEVVGFVLVLAGLCALFGWAVAVIVAGVALILVDYTGGPGPRPTPDGTSSA